MKIWALVGYSWEIGEWTTLDVFTTKEKAQQCVAEDYGDNYYYSPKDDTWYCNNENFDITRLKVVERTVR